MTTQPVVTVFGAAAMPPTDPEYVRAQYLGRLLAEAGYAVMTGGYFGSMEAVSKGARLAGGHVIGVTVSRFEGPGKRSGPNAYIDQVVRYESLRDRLLHLVDHCDAAVALPGGIGTLSEVALMWSFLQTDEVQRKPFVLLGDFWVGMLTRLCDEGGYASRECLALWQQAGTPEDVVMILNDWKPGHEM